MPSSSVISTGLPKNLLIISTVMSSDFSFFSLDEGVTGDTIHGLPCDSGMTQHDPLTEWLNTAGRLPLLPKAEVLRIAKEIKTSEEGSAKRRKLVNKLVSHNLRLVVSFVHSYMKTKTKKDWGCLETVDYLQSGALGLYRAAELFDPDKGYEFSTYATCWMRSFVGRYNMKVSSPFTLSEEACRRAYQYERHGKVPSLLGTNSKWINDPRSAVQLVRAAQAPVSLYTENDIGACLIDQLVAQETINIDQFEETLDRWIKQSKLSPTESSVVKSLYLHNRNRTEICEELDLNVKQLKKIRERAIKKLRIVVKPDTVYM